MLQEPVHINIRQYIFAFRNMTYSRIDDEVGGDRVPNKKANVERLRCLATSLLTKKEGQQVRQG